MYEQNSFDKASQIEIEGMLDISKYLATLTVRGVENFVIPSRNGALSLFLQKEIGDILIKNKNYFSSIDVKVEIKNKYNNFFLETWSNRKRFTLGWMYNSHCDGIWYYFYEEKTLYRIPFKKLKEWAFIKREIYKYPEKQQLKYDQQNDTWGRCVPIETIEKEVGFKLISLEKFIEEPALCIT